MSAVSAAVRVARANRLPNHHDAVRRLVMRKIRRGVDRLPSQGIDPAVNDVTPHGWRIAAAAVLERYPVVTPDPYPFEEKYLRGRFLWQNSVARPIPAEFFKTDRDASGASTTSTSADIADMYEPAPRWTEADERNDIRSLDRALPERLYYVVKRSPNSPNYQFPQTLATSSDVSLWAYAETALRSSFPGRPGDGFRAHFVSHTPATHLAHKYNATYQEKTGFYGVKVFFYRAQLIAGRIMETTQHDFAWAKDSELETMLGKETYEAVKPMLFGVRPKLDLDLQYEEGQDCAQW